MPGTGRLPPPGAGASTCIGTMPCETLLTIVVIVVGLFVLAVCAACFYCVRLKQAQHRRAAVNEALLDFGEEPNTPRDVEQSFTKAVGYDNLKVNVKKLRAAAAAQTPKTPGTPGITEELIDNETVSDIVMGKQVGKGSYGIVYKGSYKQREVAVKVVIIEDADRNDSTTMQAIILDFQAEVTTMCQLSHPNVVQFLGFSTRPKVTIVQEFVSGGNLHDFFRSGQPLDAAQQLCMLHDMTMGMEYLHSYDPPLIHRDLKSPNLLLDEQLRVKITDFGLARLKARGAGDETVAMTQCGTPYWTAPEILKGETYNEKVDIYSFALCAWEIWSRKVPFAGQSPMEVALKVVNRRTRPKMPLDCPTAIAAIIRACWAQHPAKRPSFEQVLAQVEGYKQTQRSALAARSQADGAAESIYDL